MPTEITVALILAAGTIVAALLGLIGVLVQQLRRAIGSPNGEGNLVQMLERLLAGQAGQDKRLASLERRMARSEENDRQVAEELGGIKTRLDTVEADRGDDAA